MQQRVPSAQDQRAAVRFDTSMPVRLRGASGLTQNISAHGVAFETDVGQEVGSLVNFTVEFTLYGQKHRLLCEGKVVRVEEHEGRVRVAARLLSPFFVDEERITAPALARGS
jgi:hypothetical protein